MIAADIADLNLLVSLKLFLDWLVNILKKNFKSGDRKTNTHTNPDKSLLNCSFADKKKDYSLEYFHQDFIKK